MRLDGKRKHGMLTDAGFVWQSVGFNMIQPKCDSQPYVAEKYLQTQTCIVKCVDIKNQNC